MIYAMVKNLWFLVGHGLSQGKRCYIDKIEELSDNVVKLANDMKQRLPEVPMFVLGHSMVRCYF